jgi:hypothetical protein
MSKNNKLNDFARELDKQKKLVDMKNYADQMKQIMNNSQLAQGSGGGGLSGGYTDLYSGILGGAQQAMPMTNQHRVENIQMELAGMGVAAGDRSVIEDILSKYVK